MLHSDIGQLRRDQKSIIFIIEEFRRKIRDCEADVADMKERLKRHEEGDL